MEMLSEIHPLGFLRGLQAAFQCHMGGQYDLACRRLRTQDDQHSFQFAARCAQESLNSRPEVVLIHRWQVFSRSD